MIDQGARNVHYLETFMAVFETVLEGILVVNREGRIMLANPAAEKLFGYPVNGLTNTSIEELIPQALRGIHKEKRSGYMMNPSPRPMGKGLDLVAQRKDGTLLPVEISLNSSMVNGELLVAAMVTDISFRKETEKALRKSEEILTAYAADLEKKVQAATEKLRETILRLEEALLKEQELNSLKSRFVSIASHEFRTPLSIIRGSSVLIEKYLNPFRQGKIESHTSRIIKSVDHLITILNDFLSLGKLEEQKVEVVHRLFDLKDLFQHLEEEVSPLLKSEQRLKIKIALENPVVTGDRKALHIMILNLLSNAIKYSPAHSVILLEAACANNMLMINVTDHGIGIPEDDKKYLTDRFFRATNASGIQGTGLGLNIVKRYADLLQGNLSFVSKVGVGSTFTITVPQF